MPAYVPTTVPDSRHQADANRRDAALMNASTNVSSTATYCCQHEKDLEKMERHLPPKCNLPPTLGKRRRQFVSRQVVSRQDFAAVGLDIATTAAPAFTLNARREDPDEELRQLLAEKLLSPDYAGATVVHFSKKDSNILPPHRPDVDHDIQLTEENTLSSSPLYNMSLEQL